MNIVHYKGHDYFNYMKYYNPDDINIFIGGRGTGKTYSRNTSIYRLSALSIDYDAENNIFRFYDWYERYMHCKPTEIPLNYGYIFNFISMEDFIKVKEEILSNEVTHTIE